MAQRPACDRRHERVAEVRGDLRDAEPEHGAIEADARHDRAAGDRAEDADDDADDAGDRADLRGRVAAIDPVRLDHRVDRELAEAIEQDDREEHAGARTSQPVARGPREELGDRSALVASPRSSGSRSANDQNHDSAIAAAAANAAAPADTPGERDQSAAADDQRGAIRRHADRVDRADESRGRRANREGVDGDVLRRRGDREDAR